MNEAKKSREKKGEYIAQSATHWPFTIVKNRWMCIEYGSRHMIEIVSFSLIGMLESFFLPWNISQPASLLDFFFI